LFDQWSDYQLLKRSPLSLLNESVV